MTDTTDLVARLNVYFVSGGLFNPELANHTAVSELVRDSRDTIERLTRERDDARRKAVKVDQGMARAVIDGRERIAKLEAALKVINEIARCDESFDASHRISWTARTALEAKP